jgi:hypothetical protein
MNVCTQTRRQKPILNIFHLLKLAPPGALLEVTDESLTRLIRRLLSTKKTYHLHERICRTLDVRFELVHNEIGVSHLLIGEPLIVYPLNGIIRERTLKRRTLLFLFSR